jgi:galactitol-specific phosphotransferase system IIB component
MNEELSKIKPDDNNISSLLNNFESKFNSLILTVSNSSESRINETINSEKNLQQHFRNEMSLFMGEVTKNMNNQSEFFDKYKNSSLKGAFGENNLERILSSLYQTAEIVNTSKETASGDFMLKRVDESSIMIENKDYSRNVPIEEVRKFIRDIEVQKCHGIFLSQHSGITSKQNFQIETKGANIMVYIHNTNYCPQTIKTAIDIIDSLEDKLLDLKREPDEEVKLSMEQLQEINNEVRRFLDKKQTVLTMLKEMSSKIEKELKTFDLSCLVKTMNGIFGVMPEQPKVIICDICNSFQAQSNKSLAAHKRKCCKKIPS